MSITLELEQDRMFENDEEIFDERMNELLKSAETRLRQGITTQSQTAQLLKQPKLNSGELIRPYITTAGDISRINSSILVKKDERALSNEIRKVEVSPSKAAKKNAESRIQGLPDSFLPKSNAGPDWFHMPRTDSALKRDLQLIRMRNILDPKRHYTEEKTSKKGPDFALMGTIVEGPTEFYSARLPKKERHATFLDEVLAQEHNTGRFNKKYGELQVAKTSGKKAHYKALKAKRRSKAKNG